MNNKIKNNSGSSMTLVIICIAMLTIFSTLICSQLINKIKFTSRSHEKQQLKYAAEAGIERTIASVEAQILDLIQNKTVYNNRSVNKGKPKKEKIRSNINESKKEWDEVGNKVKGNYKNDINRISTKISSLYNRTFNNKDDINTIFEVKKECLVLNDMLASNDKKNYDSYKTNIDKSIMLLGVAYDYLYRDNHENHPKVEFDSQEIPKWSSFNDLIVIQLGHSTQQDSIALLGDNMHWYIQNTIGIDKATELRTQYQAILSSIDKISVDINSDKENASLEIKNLEIKINECIKQMEKILNEVHESQPNFFTSMALDHTNRMIGVMEEIKCRLGMGSNNEGGTSGDIIKTINVPTYQFKLDKKNGEIKPRKISETPIDITLTYTDGYITYINFEKLNSIIFTSEGYTVDDIRNMYQVQADVDFSFMKLPSGKYTVNYNIKSYA
ncbi:MAG: hypothetical protein ACRCXA_05785 [Peptostreptococcaceae bacterium]